MPSSCTKVDTGREDGLADAAIAEAVPAVQSRKQARIPPVWNLADVAKTLDAVDRGNPCGKRDYAIILLVAGSGCAASTILLAACFLTVPVHSWYIT